MFRRTIGRGRLGLRSSCAASSCGAELVLGHGEGRGRRVRVLERVGGQPGVERGLELLPEPLLVEVREVLVVVGVGVDPLDERGHVDLGLGLGPAVARAASIRMALVVLAAFACSPFHRVAW